VWCGVIRRISFIFWAIVLLSPLVFPQTDYYVDAANGRNSNDGLSPTTAWKTLHKLNNYIFSPGDRILFKRGEVWRGQLNVTSSGAPENPVTYAAFGPGPKPRILGSVSKNDPSDWVREHGYIWYTHTQKRVYQCVFRNDTRFSRRVLRKGDLDTQGELWWDSAGNRVYFFSRENPAIQYNGNIELCQLESVVTLHSKDHVTLKDLDIRYTSRSAIYATDSNHITVDGCTLKHTGETYSTHNSYGEWSGAGIYFYQGNQLTVTNCTISYNWMGVYFQRRDGSPASHTIDNNTISYQIFGYNKKSHGIAFGGTGPFPDYAGTVIKNNDIHHFGMRGIALSHSRNVVAEHNSIHDNYGSGFNTYCTGISMGTTTSGGHIIRYNHIYNITGNPNQWDDGCGIRTRQANNSKIYYNVIHDCVKGICNSVRRSGGANDNNKIFNNICYDCSKYGIWINQGIKGNETRVSVMNNICDGREADIRISRHVKAAGGFNCLMNDSSVNNSGSYTGSNTDFYRVDPRFTDPAAHDFSLRPDSPCIDKGMNTGIRKDIAGHDVPAGMGVDMGALEYIPPLDMLIFFYKP